MLNTPLTSPQTEQDWESIRQMHFNIKRFNLNPGTLGTPSSLHREATYAREKEWTGYPVGLYQEGRKALQNARQHAEALWPNDTHNIAISLPATTMMNLWAHAFAHHWEQKDKIRVLSSKHAHYGAISSFQNHPKYQVHFLSEAELDSLDAFSKRVQEEKPDLAIFDHITYTLGKKNPVQDWYAQIKSNNPEAIVLLDVVQSVGVCPLPFSSGDILVGSAHKWLCGPWEVGFTWLRKDLAHTLPKISWMDGALDGDSQVTQYELAGGQNFSKYIQLEMTLELHRKIGLEKIYQRSQELAKYFCENYIPAQDKQTSIRVQQSEGSTILLHFEKGDSYPVYKHWNEIGIHVKCIKKDLSDTHQLNLLRLGFPFYENTKRLDQLFKIFEKERQKSA